MGVEPLGVAEAVKPGDGRLAGVARQFGVGEPGFDRFGALERRRRGRTPPDRSASSSPAGLLRVPTRRPLRRWPADPARSFPDLPSPASALRRDSSSECRPCCSAPSAAPGSAAVPTSTPAKIFAAFGDAGQPLVQHLGIEMFEMQMDMVLVAAPRRGPRGSRSSSPGKRRRAKRDPSRAAHSAP